MFKCNDAPNEPPPSPAFGCIQIFLNFVFIIPFNFELKAHPPDKQRFSIYIPQIILSLSIIFLK